MTDAERRAWVRSIFDAIVTQHRDPQNATATKVHGGARRTFGAGRRQHDQPLNVTGPRDDKYEVGS